MGAGKVLLGALAGMAVGATVGVLFAPDKGTVSRKKIAVKQKVYTKAVKRKLNDYAGEVADAYKAVKEEAGSMIDRGKETINTAKNVADSVK